MKRRYWYCNSQHFEGSSGRDHDTPPVARRRKAVNEEGPINLGNGLSGVTSSDDDFSIVGVHSSVLNEEPCLRNVDTPTHWCRIAYYEFNTQMSHNLVVPWSYHSAIINGSNQATTKPNILPIGQFKTEEHTYRIRSSKRELGAGIELNLLGDGNVTITNHSEYSSFYFSSYYNDFMKKKAPFSGVYCVQPDRYRTTKIFDIGLCYKIMEQRFKLAHSIYLSPDEHANDPEARQTKARFPHYPDMKDLTTLEISLKEPFGKAFVTDTQRQGCINQTSTWIKVDLLRAENIRKSFITDYAAKKALGINAPSSTTK